MARLDTVWRDLGGQSQVCRAAWRDPKRVSGRRFGKARKGCNGRAEIIKPTTELSEKAAPEPAKDELNVKDLALTKDASDIEYKELVEHVLFKSKANVKSVCAELSANLKAQGWTKEGRDMITPASSILKRKRGDAELTIFVKPDNGGSQVQIFTEGLSWDEE